MTPDRPAGDAGVATVFSCLALATLFVITGLGVHLGAAALARHRAEAAADLAALAGAAAVLSGTACARAAEVATANGAQLADCVQQGLDVRVQVRVAVPAAGLGAVAAGRARAGPAEPTAPG